VELAIVILIVGVLATVVTTRFEAITLFRKKGELRSFLNTWQFLLNEAASDGNSYRFIIDIDNNSYLVLQEIPLAPDAFQQVDLLKNLRLQSEKKRKQKIEDDSALTEGETFKLLDEQEQNRTLEELFALAAYSDPGMNVRLAIPTVYPSLGEEQFFTDAVMIRDVVIDGERFTEGRPALHFSPQGASAVTIVHFEVNGEVLSMILNPFSGEAKIQTGEIETTFVERGRVRGRR